jgi:hypothetical protein
MSTTLNLDALDTVHNAEASRYEMALPDGLALIEYRMSGDQIVFAHTEVPPAYEGQGVATRLTHQALADVRARGLKLVPACPFTAAFIRRHKAQYADLL